MGNAAGGKRCKEIFNIRRHGNMAAKKVTGAQTAAESTTEAENSVKKEQAVNSAPKEEKRKPQRGQGTPERKHLFISDRQPKD